MKTLRLAALLACASFTGILPESAHAVSVGLNVLDPSIQVGETFMVQVTLDQSNRPAGTELMAFGFDVNALSQLTYLGYTLGAGFDDASDLTNPLNVSGLAFPSIVDDAVLLATLSFKAMTAGTETLTALGIYDAAFYGLFIDDPSNLTCTGFDIQTAARITVLPRDGTPDAANTLLLLVLASGAGLALRIRRD